MELYNLEAEMSLLGACMLEGSLLERLSTLCVSDFYDKRNQIIFQGMMALYQAQQPLDVITLYEQVKDKIPLTYLAEIGVLVPTTEHFSAYAAIVRELSQKRRLKTACECTINRLTNSETDTQQAILLLEELLGTIQETPQQTVRQGNALLMETVGEIEARQALGGKLPGKSFGYEELDLLTGGMRPGNLIYIAGRPGMGKTMLALNILRHNARKEQVPCLFISLEMSGMELAERLLSKEAGVLAEDLSFGTVNQADMKKLKQAAGQFSNSYFCDAISQGFEEIVSEAMHCQQLLKKQKKQLGLLLVDYLQLIGGRHSSIFETVTDNSRRLKQLARKLNCPVVCLSQLSRKCEERPDKRPRLSDLRDSGAIEQDADMVLLLYREGYYTGQPGGQMEIRVAKHRNGSTGTVTVSGLLQPVEKF